MTATLYALGLALPDGGLPPEPSDSVARASAAGAAPPMPCCGQVGTLSTASLNGDRVESVPTRLTAGQVAAGALKLGQVLLGLDAASAEVVAARRLICVGCEFVRGKCLAEWVHALADDPAGAELGCCARCGCYLWAKTRKAGEQCPEGRWRE